MIRLYVPPTTPTADEARPGVPQGATTVYEVAVLDIKPTQPDDLANSLLPPAPELPPPHLSGATVEQIIETWGWVTARKAGTADFGFSSAELTDYVRGFIAAIRGEAVSFDENKIHPAVEKLADERKTRTRLATRQKCFAEMNTLFIELSKRRGIVQLPDGLRYEILKQGTGSKPKPGQIVLVDYTGQLINGTVFDQTYNEPLHVEVGSVISGWNEGIQQINKGGRIKLYVPPSIGYGDEDATGVVSRIPANSLLIYEIELLDIQERGGKGN
jgi:FKBP-type peptidyl-prolyl cis-trans isomerase